MKILYTDKYLSNRIISKTAHCIMRFCPQEVICIYDEDYSDSHYTINAADDVEYNFPVVKSINELKEVIDNNKLRAENCELIISMAPVGGDLLSHQYTTIKQLKTLGFIIINPLHKQIDMANNIRHKDTFNNTIAKGTIRDCIRILFVGTDFSNGKMTSAVTAYNSMKKNGLSVDWLATGQTGVLIKGRGCIIDSIIIDFVPGNIEKMINESKAHCLLIEGQGSILHPAYSPSSFALFHTSKPQYFVVCHRMKANKGHMENEIPDLKDFCNIYTNLAGLLSFESKLLGVCLDSSDYPYEDYLMEKNRIENELNVKCVDPIRENILPMFIDGKIMNNDRI